MLCPGPHACLGGSPSQEVRATHIRAISDPGAWRRGMRGQVPAEEGQDFKGLQRQITNPFSNYTRMLLSTKVRAGIPCNGRPCGPAMRAPSLHRSWGHPRPIMPPCRAINIDFSDPDTLVAVGGALLGVALGVGVPAFYISRDRRDEQRLEELRELNRNTKMQTGEYMTKVHGRVRQCME